MFHSLAGSFLKSVRPAFHSKGSGSVNWLKSGPEIRKILIFFLFFFFAYGVMTCYYHYYYFW